MSVPFSDGHCDFLYGMVNSGYDLNGKALRQAVSLRALKKGNVKLQLFAAWIDMAMKKPAISQFLAMADAYERMLSSNPALVKHFFLAVPQSFHRRAAGASLRTM